MYKVFLTIDFKIDNNNNRHLLNAYSVPGSMPAFCLQGLLVPSFPLIIILVLQARQPVLRVVVLLIHGHTVERQNSHLLKGSYVIFKTKLTSVVAGAGRYKSPTD